MMDILSFFQAHPWWLLITMAITALFVGSFLNVVIYRLPKMIEHSWHEECRIYLGLKPHQELEKLNLSLPLSHCPRCKNPIKPWHNIPLFSYLFLKGRCANCRACISGRYPLVELLTCVISVVVTYKFGLTWQTLGILLFSWVAITLTFIDLETHLLPDQLTLGLVWLGLFLSIFNVFCSSKEAILGAILGYGIFAFIQFIFGLFTGKTGMGQGDFKFLAAIGAFVGWQLLPLIILMASISGIIITLSQMTLRRDFKSTPLPFGPYLAIAGWVALIWGPQLMRLYFNIIYN